ncbi:MAG: cryptochrome/photolyase family protein [Devosia sp.]
MAISSLEGTDPDTDVILGAEVMEEATYVRHHKQKIALIFAAMRHHFGALKDEGFAVDYRHFGTHESLFAAVKAAAKTHKAERVIVTEPGEWRLLTAMRGWEKALGIAVEIRDDDRFYATHGDFRRWAEGRKELRMEYFYRTLRKRTGILMVGAKPVGARWNYDHDNRKSLPKNAAPPERPRFAPDSVTKEVIALVEDTFGDHFGTLDAFNWPVTRADALIALDHFITDCLPSFGDYQDAMAAGAPHLYHAVLSPLINCGLLSPKEVVERAEAACRDDAAPINAVEGFIRQILGWREFIRGIYWLKMPDYAQSNALSAHRPLPDFYWTAETDMRCMAEAIGQTRDHAYAHHIQRLMVTGNFALLAGVSPEEIEAWYLIVYADAYDWVELPNVHGMATFADGGVFASKPYAASGAYIDRMSDYCGSCAYDVAEKTGESACPFNYLYWNFLMANEAVLRDNPRMGIIYKTLDKMSKERRTATTQSATRFLAAVCGKESGKTMASSAKKG